MLEMPREAPGPPSASAKGVQATPSVDVSSGPPAAITLPAADTTADGIENEALDTCVHVSPSGDVRTPLLPRTTNLFRTVEYDTAENAVLAGIVPGTPGAGDQFVPSDDVISVR